MKKILKNHIFLNEAFVKTSYNLKSFNNSFWFYIIEIYIKLYLEVFTFLSNE